MWPFSRRSKAPVDHLTYEVDLSKLGPFREVDRYLLVWPNALSQSYGLCLVYEGRRRSRVHVVHSPGYTHGGSMENFGEWVGTAVRRRDPGAVALFLSWPPDRATVGEQKDELIRVWFDLNPSGVASRGRTVLMSEAADGGTQVDNVFVKSAECLYQDMSYGHPRQSPEHWANVLGCPVPTFTEAAWVAAADEVDPGGVQRRAVEEATASAMDGQIAWMKEMGVYGDEPGENPGGEHRDADLLEEPTEHMAGPSPAQRERLERYWSEEPETPTVLGGGCGIGGANIGNPHHPAPVVTLLLPSEITDEIPLDLSTFEGPDAPPPANRRVRLWDETLLTVEEVGRWRIVLYMDDELLPPWWFDAASAQPEERPAAILALSIGSDPATLSTEPTSLGDLGDAVGLAHLEDRRDLQRP